jgi:hypothetical protein
VGTIDKLGGMTPEQLQEIPGIDPEMVESIRDSVTAYYSQFEEAAPAAPPDEVAAEAEIASGEPQAEGAAAEQKPKPFKNLSRKPPEPEADAMVEDRGSCGRSRGAARH